MMYLGVQTQSPVSLQVQVETVESNFLLLGGKVDILK